MHLKFPCEYCKLDTVEGCLEKPVSFKCNCSSCDMVHFLLDTFGYIISIIGNITKCQTPEFAMYQNVTVLWPFFLRALFLIITFKVFKWQDRQQKQQKKNENWEIKVCDKISRERNFPNENIIGIYLPSNQETFEGEFGGLYKSWY